MPSTILVRDLLWRVSVLLADTAPQFQRWTEKELVWWLIDGQVAITKYVPGACSRIDAIKLVAGTRQSIAAIPAASCKPGDGSTPVAPIYGTQLLSLIRNMGGDGVTPGKAIFPVERDVLDSTDDGWHTRTGSAVRSLVYDPDTPRYFYVTPGVIGNVWVEASYTAQPLPIPNTGTPGAELYLASGESTQTITIADEHTDDLVNYVCARANLKDSKYAEPAKANFFAGAFLNSLNAKVTALKGASPNLKHLPMPSPGP